RLVVYAGATAPPTLVRTGTASRGRAAAGRRDQGMRGPFRRGGRSRGLSAKAGFHRYSWNLRGDNGALVLPGDYELRLMHDDGEQRQRVTLALDPRVAAEGVTVDDLRAQIDLVEKVQALSERAGRLAADVRRRSRTASTEAARATLRELGSRLDNARETYPQQMLLSQVRYLSSMINRADQRPGNHAYQRYDQLVAAVADLEQRLAALDGE
ncbi:MAG: hypothetical protein ACON4Z_16820, partial [Planctomycetota bacterium]